MCRLVGSQICSKVIKNIQDTKVAQSDSVPAGAGEYKHQITATIGIVCLASPRLVRGGVGCLLNKL